MCIVLSHSTMEERLVRMVEFKIINQSLAIYICRAQNAQVTLHLRAVAFR